jgi:hypothetical protein
MDYLRLFVAAERVFGEPLASNGLPLWLQYYGFQASFYSILYGLED